MERQINVNITGCEIETSSNLAGIQGEASSRELLILFDSQWEDFVKTITFFDANMENAVKIILSDNLKDQDERYKVKIPFEALKEGGRLTLIIDGEKEGTIFRSVKKDFEVIYAPNTNNASSEQQQITPSVASQISLRIDGLGDVLDKNSADILKLFEDIENLNKQTEEELLQKADKTETENIKGVLDTKANAISLDMMANDLQGQIGSVRTLLDNKAEKTEIMYFGSSEGIIPMSFHNTEIRFLSTPDAISVAFTDGEYPEDYIMGVSFNTKATVPEISYSNSGIINWVGTDCSQDNGISLFIPSEGMQYDIVIYFNGTQFTGLVNGYQVATGNVVAK